MPGEKYVFLVELRKGDGTLFMLGPWCRDDTMNIPPQSVFIFTVTKVGQNNFTVSDTPPTIP